MEYLVLIVLVLFVVLVAFIKLFRHWHTMMLVKYYSELYDQGDYFDERDNVSKRRKQ